MLLTLREDADPGRVEGALRGLGLWTRRLSDGHVQALAVVPPSPSLPAARLRELPGVASVLESASAHPLVDAQARRELSIADVSFSGPPVLVAGPCSAESEAAVHAAAELAAAAGARVLRGGAFKPRTSPHTFSGHGRQALRWLRDAADAHGLALVTEVMSEVEVDAVASVADMLQIGSRNMQGFALLRAAGAAGRPVLLKRGMAATVKEWLCAGEHLLAAGAASVVFCERGVRGFDPGTRNLLDLGAVALLARSLGQTVMVDPSHAAGRRDLVSALAAAGVAAGAAAVMVEVHPDPGTALSDGPQALDGAGLAEVARRMGIPS